MPEKNPRKKLKKPTDQKPIPLESIRIGTKDLHTYHNTKKGWRKAHIFLPNALQAVKLFKAHNNFGALIDKKNPLFLKGILLPDGTTTGARINILPDGRRLDKAFSLFAKNLSIHDEASNDHWDVIYENKGGTFSYVYTLEKKQESLRQKYKAVEEFSKIYPQLANSVIKALYDEEDHLSMPMYTLLKTMMRVGNETYFKAHGHKGLTTLKKSDIKILKNKVFFSYLGKDGVPLEISEEFPTVYVKRLKRKLKKLDSGSFVFTHHLTGNPLSEFQFKKAFERYCGRGFYPHIVRSYYATQKAKFFLKKHKKPSEEETKEFLRQIALKLGHKKFDKKNHEWKEDYTVTINHYVEPSIAEKIRRSLIKK